MNKTPYDLHELFICLSEGGLGRYELSVYLMNRQTTHIRNRAPAGPPQIRQMNNSYKSYGISEGDQGGSRRELGLGGAGGQGSKKGLESGRELGGLGGIWGQERGLRSLRGLWVSRGVRVMGGVEGLRGVQGLGGVSEHRGRAFGHMGLSKYGSI